MKNGDIEKLVMDLERKALDSWADGHPAGYLQNFAEESTYFDDIGAQQRIDGLSAIKQYGQSLEGQIPKHRYEIVNPKVQVAGDVAVYSFRYHPFSLEGKALTAWKATSVYSKFGPEWKIIHGHWSMSKGDPS